MKLVEDSGQCMRLRQNLMFFVSNLMLLQRLAFSLTSLEFQIFFTLSLPPRKKAGIDPDAYGKDKAKSLDSLIKAGTERSLDCLCR